MKTYLIFILILWGSLACAQAPQPLSKADQLLELQKINESYISQNIPAPKEVTTGIEHLEKELGVTHALPSTNPASNNSVPQTKQVCKKVKTSSGKYVSRCTSVKIRKKYNGTPVPTYKK